MPEVYVRGITIKYIRIPDEVMDLMREEVNKQKSRSDNRPRGAPRGRGGPRGGRGGRASGINTGGRPAPYPRKRE